MSFFTAGCNTTRFALAYIYIYICIERVRERDTYVDIVISVVNCSIVVYDISHRIASHTFIHHINN